MNTTSLSKEGWKKCPDSANPYKKIKSTSSRKHSSVSVKCIIPQQEEFVSSHKCHTHASLCSALPQQCAGTWREMWQSQHSTKPSRAPSTGQMGSAQGSSQWWNDLHLLPLRDDLCQVTLMERGGESEKPELINIQMQEKFWNSYKCCILVWHDAGLGFFSCSGYFLLHIE